MPLFFHYTDDKGADKIIRCGKIMASLNYMENDVAAFGNGVYLTLLKPPTSTKLSIAQNNWTKTSPQFVEKTKNYFVVEIPDSKVKEVDASGRNIFLFANGSDLCLWKFPWWLKDFDSGKIIASYKYTVASYGPAMSLWASKMGDYVMTDDTVNGRPVYKNTKKEMFLYMTCKGNWCVNKHSGLDRCWLLQRSKYSLAPDTDSRVLWEYWDKAIDYDNEWNKDDLTLRAYPWQS